MNEIAKKGHEAATLFAPSIAGAAVGLFLPLARSSGTSPAGIKRSVDSSATFFAVLGLATAFYVWHMLVAANLGAQIDWWVPDAHLPHLTPGGSVAILVYSFAAFLTEVKIFVEK